MNIPLVAIVMGSDSDLPIMKEAAIILEEFNIPFDITFISAHRTPDLLIEYIHAANKSCHVLIAGAGAAAHLPGVIAAYTTIPVIGVPIDATSLNGMDSLYSIVQMPSGIPVATMAIGKAGAKNAAIFAAQIIALHDPEVKKRLKDFREGLYQTVMDKSAKLKSLGWKNYSNKK